MCLSLRDLTTLSILSMAVLFRLVRYVQVILTEVITSQYDNTGRLKRHLQDEWARRRTGKERRMERKGRTKKKVGSVDKGEGGSIAQSDPSARVTREEECRVEGEKQAKKTQGKDRRETMLYTGQMIEAIRIWDLVLNSRT